MASLKKERIKDRMQKTAARLWGIPDNEIETNFDPLVMLLIEACASEMEKIGHAINNSHERLLEKLAELIVPEAIVGAKPASAIAAATPVETAITFTNQTAFISPQSILNYSTNSPFNYQFYFTPIGNFKVLKAVLTNIVIGHKFYKISGNNTKELIHNAATNNQVKVNEIWLGISPDKNLTSLKGLSICFQLRSYAMASAFYASLTLAKAQTGNTEDISLSQGYFDQDQFELNPKEMLISGHDYSNKINRQISDVYQQQFLHISGDAKVFTTTLPEALESQLPKTIASKFGAEPMMYIKIQLNRYFTQEDLDGLNVHINAFPVVNRRLYTTHYRTDPWINIVPLQVEGSFLDIQSIDSGGSKYKFRASAEQQNLDDGEAIIRSSGVGKTNSKEVRDIIANLMDAIRDESAYFSETSNDFISSRLKEISMILSRLNDQMQKSKDLKEAKHYLLLKPKTAGETVAITYWATDGTMANQINAGGTLTPHNHTQVGNKDAFLISSAVGGRDRTLDNEKKSLLKQQIISKGKIVSAYDIKMICYQTFGNNLVQVGVEKTVAIGSSSSEGFSRIIQIKLELKNKEAADVPYLCRELETILSREATIVYPFKVVIQ